MTPTGAPARIPADVFVEVTRLLIVAIATASGYQVGNVGVDAGLIGVLGAVLGACLGYVTGGILGRMLGRATGSLERRVDTAPAASLAAGALGALATGGMAAVLGFVAVALLPEPWGWPVFALLVWVAVYAGFQAGARKGEELVASLARPAAPLLAVVPEPTPAVTAAQDPGAVLDTSVIIDGRLLDVAAAGFLPGPLLVARFVLDELQGIADAQDAGRRRRGHRGLETLEALRHDPTVDLRIVDDEVPERVEVDAKLVVLAARLGADLLTIDANLQHVAELQGVRCRNLHRLAVSLRPVLVPGEVIRLPITREGKEPGQGVGFLDDGTMIVVTDASTLVGAETDVCIASAVQTSRGRMFFASLAG